MADIEDTHAWSLPDEGRALSLVLLGRIAMVYIVIDYIVMAYLVVAYIVVAYITVA